MTESRASTLELIPDAPPPPTQVEYSGDGGADGPPWPPRTLIGFLDEETPKRTPEGVASIGRETLRLSSETPPLEDGLDKG